MITELFSLTKECIVIPRLRAQDAASEEQAPIDAILDILQRAALATMSQPHLPLNSRIESLKLMWLNPLPITLSTALWRPISSL